MFLHIKYMSYPQYTIRKLCPTQTNVSTLSHSVVVVVFLPRCTTSFSRFAAVGHKAKSAVRFESIFVCLDHRLATFLKTLLEHTHIHTTLVVPCNWCMSWTSPTVCILHLCIKNHRKLNSVRGLQVMLKVLNDIRMWIMLKYFRSTKRILCWRL